MLQPETPLDPATPGLGATVVTEPTEASLRGGDSIVSAAHPTPDERRADILRFLEWAMFHYPTFLMGDIACVPQIGIDGVVDEYVRLNPRGS